MIQDTINFHDLYSRYAREVYRFAFWLTGNTEDAEDITSETFVRVWMSDAEIRVGSVKAYLFTIARNLHLHNKRRTKRITTLDEAMVDLSAPPDHVAEVRSEITRVLEALQTLPEIDRAVLIMRVEDELSYQEIASATGLSVSAVKVKVYRARLKLHSLIST